jgi:hypothetical protein
VDLKRSSFIGGATTALAALSLRGANASQTTSGFSLQSDGIAASWTTEQGSLRASRLVDRRTGADIPLPREVFRITFADGTVLGASGMRIVSGPTLTHTTPNPRASRYADRIGATTLTLELTDNRSGAHATWRAISSDGAGYLRQSLTLAATSAPLAVRDVRTIDFPVLPDALPVGTCDGSPIVAGNIYVALEHPFAQVEAIYDRAFASYPSKLDIAPGAPLTLTSVIGSTRPGQLRRDFLTYLERERAHPYRTFLHYNSWYDIGYFTRYDQNDCLSRITAFGEELHDKRGVTLASFLFDDGWDDPNYLWAFNNGFPNGFSPLAAAAARYGAKPGAWLSPWGGYGDPRRERLAAARAAGYEIDDDGLALSGPKYYRRFYDVTMRFIDQGVNQFKLDGTGDTATVVPGSAFGSDFGAAINLIGEMRAAEPDIYINLTTGTYPSPFWLMHCDSIWRGGEDHTFAGVGTHRQQWITYRDADTYAGIVNTGPLYPLNSLMLHGLIFAQHAKHLDSDPGNDFPDEVRSYFGTGTQLQEMYISPQLLSSANWDHLARGARWAAANASILRDTHWVGGNPARLDVYGWASWSKAKGILVLRNPSDRIQSIPLDIGAAFELPNGAPQTHSAVPVNGSTAERRVLHAGRESTFVLRPFEVAAFEVSPVA